MHSATLWPTSPQRYHWELRSTATLHAACTWPRSWHLKHCRGRAASNSTAPLLHPTYSMPALANLAAATGHVIMTARRPSADFAKRPTLILAATHSPARAAALFNFSKLTDSSRRRTRTSAIFLGRMILTPSLSCKAVLSEVANLSAVSPVEQSNSSMPPLRALLVLISRVRQDDFFFGET